MYASSRTCATTRAKGSGRASSVFPATTASGRVRTPRGLTSVSASKPFRVRGVYATGRALRRTANELAPEVEAVAPVFRASGSCSRWSRTLSS